MSTYFECKVKYDRTLETGAQKTVTEPYLVDALSFTEAEARITEEVQPFTTGEFAVTAVKKVKFDDIFFHEGGDRWYKVKVQFITIDEKTAKEKKSAVNYLVNAGTLNGAVKNIDEVMSGTMIDYVIASVAETALMDVFEYGKDKQSDATPEYEQ